ncbi:NADH dehydrogenase subunit M [Pseudoxanthobacter soli DSM 19599]|uniref:NADH dehydrogenase subunit M n=1 Tax=Pseudoxanthobacter soli DSM 19599 TaxID=1123029 RepID=A0A1M7ZMP3_9HYPH|nr:NADH-quinone oxidoreductase subunit M [Pseudoxanthobacter soli]SHO66178.1 NADH dehydrogenase subunit M [Pseudoxanthobacter soli DSM 19599]
MSEWPILSIVTFLPLVGVLFILLVRGDDEAAVMNIRRVALITTVFTFLVSLIIWAKFDPADAGFQFVEETGWLGGSINYKMGVDGISMLFVILTTFLMPFCILASWESIHNRVKEYMIAFLVLETLMIGVFSALDLVLFYVFFEGGLIPMFIIIGVWGGPRRVYASFKFFLYTLTGSVLMLLAIMAMYWNAGTTDIVALLNHPFPVSMQTWLWLAFFASFAVKMPMWPVHTWLPDAHVEAPTAGSVILAGILLKMGGYGFLRFSLPMFPVASADFAPLVFTLSVVAIVYTSLVALMQEDMKKLIAYSSVAHMGYVTMGIFAANVEGVQGSLFQMISHGFVSGALFLCVGVVYDRMHTREIAAYGGLVNRMPAYALAFMVFTMANVGLPGTSGFIGEFLTLLAVFKVNTWVALFATTGVILSASYALWLYRRVVFGALDKESLKSMMDLSLREKVLLVPLIALTILFGVWPAPIMNATATSVASLVSKVETSVAAARAGEGAVVADGKTLLMPAGAATASP